MTALLTRMHVAAFRLVGGMRTHWRRVLVGAFCGWLLSSVLGAFALVWLEVNGVVSHERTAPLVGAAMVWSGTALGAVLAYAAKPRPRAPAGARSASADDRRLLDDDHAGLGHVEEARRALDGGRQLG